MATDFTLVVSLAHRVRTSSIHKWLNMHLTTPMVVVRRGGGGGGGGMRPESENRENATKLWACNLHVPAQSYHEPRLNLSVLTGLGWDARG